LTAIRNVIRPVVHKSTRVVVSRFTRFWVCFGAGEKARCPYAGPAWSVDLHLVVCDDESWAIRAKYSGRSIGNEV
jgi:hypothetical protein